MTTDQMGGAEFSRDHEHRLVLWRNWNDSKRVVMCVGLNPSTANENKNDRTIDFLVKFLRANDYGCLRMVNLFTQVTSKPSELSLSSHWDLDFQVIKSQAERSQEVIFCWGTFREARERGKEVIQAFPNALCFGVNADGSPKHPAWYVRNGIKPENSVIGLRKYSI